MPSLQAQAEAIARLYVPPDIGRPSDIGSASTVQQFLEAIGDGNYIETSAKLAGLSKQTVYDWIKLGQAGKEPFATFVDSLEKAEARAEAQMVANVRKASNLPQFWAAGMTVLERKYPDRWGRRADDNSVPKVVVQIGVGQGDVKVGIIQPTFALEPQALSDGLHSLTEAHESNNNELCQLTSAPQAQLVPADIHIGETRRADPAGDPTPRVARAGGQGRLARHKAKLAQTRKKARLGVVQNGDSAG